MNMTRIVRKKSEPMNQSSSSMLRKFENSIANEFEESVPVRTINTLLRPTPFFSILF